MNDKLGKYNKKRNFAKTSEPEGTASSKEKNSSQLKFVIQHHIARREHYDLRLEWEGTLLSWAVPKGPSYNTEDKRLAVKVEDHPLDYRHFEGTIPKGEYGGGTVMLWDEGYWETQYDIGKSLEKGSLKFTLHGKRLIGNWALVRIKSKEENSKDNWLLIKEKDAYAKDADGISHFTTGIRSGLTMAEIKEQDKPPANPFSKTSAKPALLTNQPPEGEDWIFEPKYDGYRIIAFVEHNTARLVTRNDNDFTAKFSSIKTALLSHAGDRAVVLDGEVVIVDDRGHTDFQALQNYIKHKKTGQLTYAIFDILALDGKDLRHLSLQERKSILDEFLQDAPDSLYLSKSLVGDGKQSFATACKLKLEGLIGKKLDSKYNGSRNGDWVKIKCGNRQEFVIGGYTRTEKKTEGISALVIGYYEDGKLIHAGRAGTGFSENLRKELAKKFQPYLVDNSPFDTLPPTKSNESVFWVRPKFVCEVQFTGWTDGGTLRQPSFKGLREDKDPKIVTKEMETQSKDTLNHTQKTSTKPSAAAKDASTKVKKDATKTKDTEGNNANIKSNKDATASNKAVNTTKGTIVGGVKVSSPNKVIFTSPEINKLDIVSYYEKVSKRMLEYAGGRILSIIRCPKGVRDTCFYKKHPDSPGKGVLTIPVTSSGGKESDYFYIDSPIGFVSEAQMGTLEFHTWGSLAEDMERPDIMVFDLDPDEGMELDSIRQGVSDLKEILDELSLVSYLKVSGGKGYHIVVPFEKSVNWDVFGNFAKQVAEVMAKRYPERYTTNMRKERRKGKIFVDWVRNRRGATSVAAYSLRAREGATVAAPILWEELDTIAPNGITMEEAVRRLDAPEPWTGFFAVKQRINL